MLGTKRVATALWAILWPALALAQGVQPPVIPPGASILPLNNTWTGSNNFTGTTTLSGPATAVTQSPGDNTTKIATDAFVQAALVAATANIPCTSAASVGFTPGGTDNLAAWNSWLTSIGSASACLQFGPGLWQFSAQLSGTLAASQTVVVKGATKDATELYWPSSNGFNLTMNPGSGAPNGYITSSSFALTGAAITTGSVASSNYYGLIINGQTTQANGARTTVVRDVVFRGHAVADYWYEGAYFQDLSNVTGGNIDCWGNVAGQTTNAGACIEYYGSSSSTIPTVLNVNNVNAVFLATAIYAHGYIQGVNVTQSDLTDVAVGVNCTAPVSAPQPQCNITNTQIDAVLHDIILDNFVNSTISSNTLYMVRPGFTNLAGMVELLASPTTIVSNNSFDGSTQSGNTPVAIDAQDASQTYDAFSGNAYLNVAYSVNWGTGPDTGSVESGNASNGSVDAGSLTGLTRFGVQDSRTNFHISTTGAPTIASGGGTGATVNGNSNDESGQFVTGSGTVSSITLTFATAFPNFSFCTVSQVGGTVNGTAEVSSNTAQIAVTWATALTVVTSWNYICRGG